MEIFSYGQRLLQATNAIVLNTLINNYALERVAFGFEKPGDQAPIYLYLKHLRLDINDASLMRMDIPGVYIDEQERISAEYDCAEYVRDLFVLQMERIFSDAPKDIRLERIGEEIPLSPRIREYLLGIVPFFAEVLKVEVDYNVFDGGLKDLAASEKEYCKWKKFVTAILIKSLKSNSRINRYVKNFTAAPQYICRLIEKKGKNFYLKPIDINGYEYIFALFSLMLFVNDENGKMLKLKMSEWERRHKPTDV